MLNIQKGKEISKVGLTTTQNGLIIPYGHAKVGPIANLLRKPGPIGGKRWKHIPKDFTTKSHHQVSNPKTKQKKLKRFKNNMEGTQNEN